MSKKVRLRYEFEFDPSELWSSKSGFDNALIKFFNSQELEAEVITFIGASTDNIICLYKKKEVEVEKPKMMSKPVKRK